MLVKPDIKDERIIHCLQDEYGLLVSQLTFLPLGADINTAVYRIGSPSGKDYFLKLRKNVFAEISVAVPQFLSQHGIRAIIPPLETRQGQAYTTLDDYAVVLYPFVEGKDGYEISLSNPQWQAFGAAIRTLHDTRLTPELASHIPREQFSAWGRESVTRFQELVDETSFTDETAAALAAFMRSKRGLISTIVSRTDQLAHALQARSNELVLCHAD
ncbi:MAG TPA: hypothetical protein VFM46_04810, partial [Pseudomonadales bacterium]|nr:hypothetical protein [Pseudomonadales bacterium]